MLVKKLNILSKHHIDFLTVNQNLTFTLLSKKKFLVTSHELKDNLHLDLQ